MISGRSRPIGATRANAPSRHATIVAVALVPTPTDDAPPSAGLGGLGVASVEQGHKRQVATQAGTTHRVLDWDWWCAVATSVPTWSFFSDGWLEQDFSCPPLSLAAPGDGLLRNLFHVFCGQRQFREHSLVQALQWVSPLPFDIPFGQRIQIHSFRLFHFAFHFGRIGVRVDSIINAVGKPTTLYAPVALLPCDLFSRHRVRNKNDFGVKVTTHSLFCFSQNASAVPFMVYLAESQKKQNVRLCHLSGTRQFGCGNNLSP